MYLPYLDQMYAEVCKIYSLDPNINVWKGKLPIYAFAGEADFQRFEMTFFGHPMLRAERMPVKGSDGTVLTSCYAGPKPIYLAVVMVHETTTASPSATSRAMTSPTGSMSAPTGSPIGSSAATTTSRKRVQAAIARMQLTHSLGGDFFTARNIEGWQYGVAVSMTDFLLNYDPSGRASRSSSRSSSAPSRRPTTLTAS